MGRARRAERAEHLPAACCLLVVLEAALVDMLLMVDMVRRMAGKWVARGERSEPSICLVSAACCLLVMLPDGGFNGRHGGQKKPNFMLYNILLTVIVLIIVIDVILLRQIFVYVLDIYYLCSDFKTI